MWHVEPVYIYALISYFTNSVYRDVWRIYVTLGLWFGLVFVIVILNENTFFLISCWFVEKVHIIISSGLTMRMIPFSVWFVVYELAASKLVERETHF